MYAVGDTHRHMCPVGDGGGEEDLFSSSLVVQWDPGLPYYFPTCKFIRGGTVGPNSNLFLPFFTISSLVVQWALPPL